MRETIAGITIPDSPLVAEATRLLREAAPPLLFDHSCRVYLLGMLRGRQLGLKPDPELFYVGAMFHDLGLTKAYRTDQRYELDGADEARRFLTAHGVPEADVRKVWLAIALHTIREVPSRLEPEIALMNAGTEIDILGSDYRDLDPRDVAAITAAYPRPDFKHKILEAFTDALKDRPATTFGAWTADILAHFVPGYERIDFVEVILNSDWPE